MGRPPKNPEIRRLEGNPGKRSIPKPAAKATGEVVVPAHLDEDAQACIEMIKRSLPPETYATADLGMLQAYAVAWSEHKKAVIALRTEPRIVEGSTGQLALNPWLKHLNEQARLIATIGARLFLDPVARATLKTQEQAPKSKFANLTGEKAERKTSSTSLNS